MTRHSGPAPTEPKDAFLRAAGCADCSHTGFRDRVGVDEVLEVTDEVRQVMVDGGTPDRVRDVAIEQGMRTMAQEAMRPVARDLTTIDEVTRTVDVA